MAQQRHGRHHSNVRLTVEGEDRQEKDGVGMKMEGVDLIVTEDGVEDVGEGGNQPGNGATREEGVESAARGLRLGRADPKHSLLLLVTLRHHQAHGGQALLYHARRLMRGLVPGWRRGSPLFLRCH